MINTTVNHDHRKELGLTMEEYVIAKEAYHKRFVNPMDRADMIVAKCGYTLDRVIRVIAQIYHYGLISEGDNGLEFSEKWNRNYDKYYPAVK